MAGEPIGRAPHNSFYVLVRNHTEGMELYQLLKNKGFGVRISPTPRQARACCGMSLLARPGEIKGIRAVIEQGDIPIERIVELENQIDPNRDRFC